MKKTYLVTGGSGFIGSALCRRLVNTGNKVIVVDNNQRGSLKKLDDILEKITCIQSDIRDQGKIIECSKNVDCIIHAAYVNGTEFFYERPEEIIDIAIKGMLSVIESCKANNIKELVLISSSEVYQSPSIIPTPENVPLIIPDITNPRFSYGGGKIASELMLMSYCKQNFKKAIIVRPHNVYGIDMGLEHVIPQLIKKILLIKEKKEKILKIQGNGSETRAFTHIEDFVDGFEIALRKGNHLDIFHIGSPEETKIMDLTKKILNLMEVNAKIENSELKKGSTLRRCPDISKISHLGFKPKITISEGLPKIINWYSNNIKI
jgi:nucleoside-diphosphate-sugar epimerase